MQRLALLGAGFIGAVHAENLAANPAVDFRFVYDRTPGRAEALAARYGAVATSDLDDVFHPSQIDAVLIATSTNTHASLLRRAADTGVAVLCEKPIDASYQASLEAVEYVEARGTRAMVDFSRRFDRDHGVLRDRVTAGSVGNLELLQLTSRGPQMPPLEYIAISGGIMRDSVVHFFDLARWITGEDPVEVFASGSALADPRITQYDDVDTAIVSLRTASGALVQIDSMRRIGYGYDERIEAVGSTGMIVSARQRAGYVEEYGGGSLTSDGLHPRWFERLRPTYGAALGAFVDALEQGSAMPVTLRDALAAQAIAESATASLRSGQSERIVYDHAPTKVS